LVFASVRALGGEDGGTVAVRVGVDQSNGFIQSINRNTNQNRTENFFGVTTHVRLNIGQDRGANEVAVRVAVDLDVATVEDELGALLDTRFNEFQSTSLGLTEREGKVCQLVTR
jgi:hypothetical protein